MAADYFRKLLEDRNLKDLDVRAACVGRRVGAALCLTMSVLFAGIVWSPARAAAPDLGEMRYRALSETITVEPDPALPDEVRTLGRLNRELAFNAEEMALEILVLGLDADADVTILLRSGDGADLEEPPASQFLNVSDWTDVHPVPVIEVLVRGRPQQDRFTLEVRGVALGSADAQADQVIEPAGFEHVTALDQQERRQRADPVARLVMEGKVKNGVPYDRRCSGFLIGPRLLMTAYHCIDGQPICSGTVALFGFDDLRRTPEAVWCEELLYATPVLDVAFVRLAGDPGVRWGFLSLVGKSYDYRKGGPLVVIQHPRGALKRVSRDGACKIGNSASKKADGIADLLKFPQLQKFARDVAALHGCDTDPGSSGSPVMNRDTGEVTILHNFGRRSPHLGHNRGIRIAEIRKCVIIKKTAAVVTQRPGTGQRCKHRPAG